MAPHSQWYVPDPPVSSSCVILAPVSPENDRVFSVSATW